MLSALYFTLLFAVTSVLSTPTNFTSRGCGTYISADDARSAEESFQSSKVSADGDKTFSIRVYWHVISKDSSVAGGNIPLARINQQIAVLNKDYSKVGVKWTLAGVTRRVNAAWYDLQRDTSEQATMKAAQRQGGRGDMNVWSVGAITTSDNKKLLGYATFPWWYAGKPKDDGVVLLQSSLPGGPAPFGLGRTLTHEAGHWVGLYHTFQGGCAAPGDYVSDTPAEATPAFGCPVGRNTCPSAGLDPIRNFMDYTDDSCMNTFTTGQGARLSTQLTTYRGL